MVGHGKIKMIPNEVLDSFAPEDALQAVLTLIAEETSPSPLESAFSAPPIPQGSEE